MPRRYVDVASPILQAYFANQAEARAREKQKLDQENEIAQREQQAKQFQERLKIEQGNQELRRKANEAAQKHQQFVEKIQDEKLKQDVLQGIKSGKLPIPIQHTQNVDDAAMHGVPYELIPDIQIGGTKIPAGMVPYGFQSDTEIAQGQKQQQLDLSLAGIQQRLAQMDMTAKQREADRLSREKQTNERLRVTQFEGAANRANRIAVKGMGSVSAAPETQQLRLEAIKDASPEWVAEKLTKDVRASGLDTAAYSYDWSTYLDPQTGKPDPAITGGRGIGFLSRSQKEALDDLSKTKNMLYLSKQFKTALENKDPKALMYKDLLKGQLATLRTTIGGLGVLNVFDIDMLKANQPGYIDVALDKWLKGYSGKYDQMQRSYINGLTQTLGHLPTTKTPDGRILRSHAQYLINKYNLRIPEK